MAVNKVVKSDGTTLIDLSNDTVTSAEHIMSGYVGHLADGSQATGTGQGSSWTKVAETTVTVNTTDTSAATVLTWSTGDSSLWTSDAYVFVKIRDTAGKRAGYFYGSDNFFVNQYPINNETGISTSYRAGHNYRYTSDATYNVVTSGTNGYGVYADAVYSDGRIRIRSRYSESYSLTIDGTYKVEVYLLTPPSAIFA